MIHEPPGVARGVDARLVRQGARASGSYLRILRAVAAAYPSALAREDLAGRTLQSASSSGLQNNLGALRTLGLIDDPRSGEVAATSR